MGDIGISNAFRKRLERELDGLQALLQQTNDANKPPPIIRLDDGGYGIGGLFHKVFGW